MKKMLNKAWANRWIRLAITFSCAPALLSVFLIFPVWAIAGTALVLLMGTLAEVFIAMCTRKEPFSWWSKKE